MRAKPTFIIVRIQEGGSKVAGDAAASKSMTTLAWGKMPITRQRFALKHTQNPICQESGEEEDVACEASQNAKAPWH